MQCELCPQNLTDSAGKLIPGLVVVDVLGMFQQHSQYAVPAFVILFCAEIIFCYIRILCDVYGVPLPTFSFGGENAGINSKYARWAFVILFCAEIIFCYIRILCDVYGVPLPTFSFGGENAGINSQYAF